MKHGSGIKGRDDKSSGIEILMVEAFTKINPTDPLIQGIQVKFLFKKISTKSKFKVCSRVQEPVLNMFKKIKIYLDIFTHC